MLKAFLKALSLVSPGLTTMWSRSGGIGRGFVATSVLAGSPGPHPDTSHPHVTTKQTRPTQLEDVFRFILVIYPIGLQGAVGLEPASFVVPSRVHRYLVMSVITDPKPAYPDVLDEVPKSVPAARALAVIAFA